VKPLLSRSFTRHTARNFGLNELGILRGETVDAPYGSGLSFRDPDGIALEFFARPA
jgi:hypothetical protein